jgi:UDP-N-acetylmuramate dehydrogenase
MGSEAGVSLADSISRAIEGPVLEGEPLSRHTSFGIGGPADLYIRPASEEELVEVLRLIRSHEQDMMIIGRGTNILVGDGGVRGAVVDLRGACRRLERDGEEVIAGAGVFVSELLDFCLSQELGGLEFMAGIPGSVGGAVRVNAGAWDLAIGDRVEAIRGYDHDGREVTLERRQLRFGYRQADLPGDLVIAETRLSLISGQTGMIASKMDDVRLRRRHQPVDQKSAGSVFKNPPSGPAGRLIEEAGCKGLRVDGAQVSPQHANFIINVGGATAAAVRELIGRVRRRVKEHSGIELEPEIIFVGED